MKTIWSKYKHWLSALVLALAGLLILNYVFTEPQSDAPIASVTEAKPWTDDSMPYANSGPAETDDNFFIPGQFASPAALAEPDKPTIVWISAPWCQVCRSMRAWMWQSANQYRDSLAIKEISFEDNYDTIVIPNNLFSTPTFLVVDSDGSVRETFFGSDEQSFNTKLEEIINQ